MRSEMNRRVVAASTLGMVAVAGTVAVASPLSPRAIEGAAAPKVSIVQRPAVPAPDTSLLQGRLAPAATFPNVVRTIDGTDNNVANPTWGAAGTPLLRIGPSTYADGVGKVPGGINRPSARAVSNACHSQTGVMPNSKNASDWLWQWGQFLDHDIDETPIDGGEAFDIDVPLGDPFFDPFAEGGKKIGLERSTGVYVNGRREQLNNITAYIDGSAVYGSEHEREVALRTLDGTGRLLVSEGDLLPFNEEGLANADNGPNPLLFLAGDVRANEQAGLTAVHTLFVREHNWWADRIRTQNPNLSGEEVYQFARAMVGAEMQAITYNEFLPLLLGENAIPPYTGYKPNVDASISNEFANAAYRVGHTMLSSNLQRLGPDMQPIGAGNINLADAFFNPALIIDEGIEPHLRGLCAQRAQEIDLHVIGDVRNFLFGQPGKGGFDLASLNIQRGRDHGLATYNQIRGVFGLAPAADFTDINPDPAVANALASVYSSPNLVDAWTGMLAEPRFADAMVGETLYELLRDQFIRLRDGDRFWYQRYLPPALRAEAHTTTLSDIIRRNSPIGDEIQDNAFVVPTSCNAADLSAPFGELDIQDVVVFLQAFGANDPSADLAAPFGDWDISDVVEFLNVFGAGCP